MRRFLIALAATLALFGLAPAGPAFAASSTEVYYETVAEGDVSFIPACTPGPQNPTCDPRGPGSVLTSKGTLAATQGGPAVGSITTTCVTTRKVGADYYGACYDKLVTPSGTRIALGEINESGLERYEPQTLCLTLPHGTLTIQQIVYPNVFKLTLEIA
ncbi:hypothetical protein [Nonomuraea sp. LPB2021202275-12-8]|uniref:hypothetical protein n=1 Tax=Nonomuraea sp. LPB2021202275-12-8 TaxID=3120159 RepID=UPI00300D070B